MQEVLRATGRGKTMSAGPLATDEDLFLAYRDRADETALAALVERHWSKTYRLALAIVRDPAAAEDLAQEAFFAVVESAREKRTLDPFAGWLRTVVLNGARNVLKMGQRRAKHEAGASSQRKEAASGPFDPAAAVREYVEALPEKLREALTLHFGAGLTHAEVGSVLGCPTGTAASRIRLGLEQLRGSFATVGSALSIAAIGSLLATSTADAAEAVPPAPSTASLAARARLRPLTPATPGPRVVTGSTRAARSLALALALVAGVGGAFGLFSLGAPPAPPAPAPLVAIPRPVEPIARDPLTPETAAASSHGVVVAPEAASAAAPRFPDIDGHPAGRLRGHVVDLAAKPVEGAVVSFESFPPLLPIFERTTDAAGTFAVDVPAASYHVRIVAPGFTAASDDLHVFPGSDRAFAEDFVLEPGSSVEGLVTSEDGSAITGATVMMSGPYEESVARTGPDGRFLLREVPAGSREMRVTAPRHFPGSLASVPVVLGETTHEAIQLRVAGELSGHLRLGSGEGVRGWVRAFRGTSWLADAEAEVDGSFTLGPVTPGPVSIVAQSADRALSSASAALVVARATTPVEVVLGKGAMLEGRLKDSRGEPLAGFTVEVVSPEGGRVESTESDEDGHYAFAGIVPGEYAIEVRWHPEFLNLRSEVTVPAPGPVDLTIPDRANLSMTFHAPGGEPAGTLELWRDGAPGSRNSSYFRRGTESIALPPGTYRYVAFTETPATAEIVPLFAAAGSVVVAGETTNLTVDLEPAAFVSGRLLGPGSQGIVGAAVAVDGDNVPDSRRRLTATGEGGRFRIGPLAAGQVTLSVRPDSLLRIAARCRVARASVRPIVLTLEAGETRTQDVEVLPQ
jgi:RNA polymerase sigma-70 factor (ECF subfamily)